VEVEFLSAATDSVDKILLPLPVIENWFHGRPDHSLFREDKAFGSEGGKEKGSGLFCGYAAEEGSSVVVLLYYAKLRY
jgi:hypothetical protein